VNEQAARSTVPKYKKHLNPTDPARYPADWEERKSIWKDRDYPLRIHTHGWYGFLRELMGVEELSFAFFDQPGLIEEISEFWADFIIRVFDRALAEVTPDHRSGGASSRPALVRTRRLHPHA